MRLMALGILNVAFEVGGKSIGRFEVLRTLVTDDFCKYVFQLAKTDSIPLLSLSLRVISTVFDTLRPYMKLQQELFIFFLIERLSPHTGNRGISVNVDNEGNTTFVSSRGDLEQTANNGDIRSASPNMFLGKSTDYPRHNKNYSSSEQMAITAEVRELLLESLLQFARMPTFMIDLWYNYDCDLTCGDLFEELIQFLSKVVQKYVYLLL
jgi:brefeldin A-resistance guanine nucleotide exchange factor 1